MSRDEATAIMTDRLLGTVRDLEPILRRHAPEAEQERRLSVPVVAAMRGAGLYGLFRGVVRINARC